MHLNGCIANIGAVSVGPGETKRNAAELNLQDLEGTQYMIHVSFCLMCTSVVSTHAQLENRVP